MPTLSNATDDLSQRVTFASPEQEAQISLTWTASLMMDAFERLLAPFEITPAQFNVLRILRGAGPCGLGRNQIRDRLISRMPDVTRLLERMESAGLVTRERDTSDRRCVPTQITDKARGILAQLDPVLMEHQQRLWKDFSETQLKEFVGVLAALRARL